MVKNKERDTLIGILVDTSASMKERHNKSKVNLKENNWIRSLISTIDDLVLHDLDENHNIFVIGVGSRDDKTFDILNTLKDIDVNKYEESKYSMNWIITKTMNILKENGAPFIFSWAGVNTICKVIDSKFSFQFAAFILSKLESENKFIQQVVDVLPDYCKTGVKNTLATVCVTSVNLVTLPYYVLKENSFEGYKPASDTEILEVINKIILKIIVYSKTIFSIKEAQKILHKNKDYYEKPIDEERTENLKKNLEPFIYGDTPLNQGLIEAAQLMSKSLYVNRNKFLFVFSDGEPTDYQYNAPLEMFKELNVTIVCGLITKSTHVAPMHLYCEENPYWAEDVKYMFRLSSTILTEELPLSIFVKRDWEIDYSNNETKLFLQINHCDNMKEVSKFAKDVICKHEVLSDILAYVSLDTYINRYNTSFKETPGDQQKKPICYAYAVATVIHLSLKRILGKDDIPEFKTLVDEISTMYNNKPASTIDVLANFCKRYNLFYKNIDLNAAKKKIIKKIPIIALFYLSDADKVGDEFPESEWKRFHEFFDDNPKNDRNKKFFSQTDLSLYAEKRQKYLKKSGHAVVLTSFNSEGLQFMNSWGANWGDNGFFRVAYGTMEFTFFYVGWRETDLTEKDKNYFNKYGNKIAKEKWEKFKGLKNQTYLCPICKQKSLVSMFSGNLSNVSCPRCNGQFKANDDGNILALNIYLTSLM